MKVKCHAIPRRSNSAASVELALLNDAEELGLGLGGELADLVEEDRPAVGLDEQARLVGACVGERSLLVAE